MLSTDIKQGSMITRIEQVVSILMEERPLFKEDIDSAKMVEHLTKVFEKNLSFEEFNTMSDSSLKNRCSGIMSIQLLGKIGEDFTPEQMAIFEDAIKRK
ncbi:MAG TPA: hypothetical protein DDZ60_13355 [Planktothrix sp. UBA10369]|jgi:hypothetical protein|nr:hypothetical protein [Planktothrix sp. UBA10369]